MSNGDGRGLHCFLCGTNQGRGDPKKFKLPNFGDPLSENDRIRANSHDSRVYCKCGSALRLELSGAIVCAECHAEISPAPRKRKTLRPLARIRTIPAR
jgi:hypothetical protein